MTFLRYLRIFIWAGCGAGFCLWIYWTFFNTPAVKPDFVSQGDYVNVDGTQMHFLEKGIGRCVILLSGFPLNAESYSRLLEYPWPQQRVIALDLPDQGYSEKKGTPVSPEDLALALKLFLDKLEIQDVDLVGHDLGAGVAMIFAASYPHRVRKLVLLAPPLKGLPTDTLGPWWRWPLVGEAWSFFGLNQAWYRHWLSRGWISTGASWQPMVELYFRPLSTFAGRKGFLAILRGSSRYDYAFYQERLKTPVLAIRGEDDPFCPAESFTRLPAALPQASIKTLPGVGHFLPEEAPFQVYESIEGFLAGAAFKAAVLPPVLENETPIPAPAAWAPLGKPPLKVRKKSASAPGWLKNKPLTSPTAVPSLTPAPAREALLPTPVTVSPGSTSVPAPPAASATAPSPPATAVATAAAPSPPAAPTAQTQP